MKKAFSILLVLIGLSQASAQVVVYTECNYSGNAQTLKVNSYINSTKIGLPDNSISSIKIPAGYKATIYTDANMKGREVALTENQKCLPSILNDAISSIIITKTSTNIANGGKISIYSSCNYRGKAYQFAPNNYSDLRKSLGNNLPQSFQIPSGLQIELYSQKNFKGKKLATYSSNVSCTSKTIQQARSIKIVKKTTTVKPQPR